MAEQTSHARVCVGKRCCHVAVQEYIVNLWTQDRESSQPISMSTFKQHLTAETGTNATFDAMWKQMQAIIGNSPVNCITTC